MIVASCIWSKVIRPVAAPQAAACGPNFPNRLLVGGEIAVGTNHMCWPPMGLMRNDKKSLGAMHFGIGHGADRGIVKSSLRLEGIASRVTIVVDDDKIVCEDGHFKV